MNLSLKSTDDSLPQHQQPENNFSNETVILYPAPNDKENQNQRRKSSWTSRKDLPDIKTEAITPVR